MKQADKVQTLSLKEGRKKNGSVRYEGRPIDVSEAQLRVHAGMTDAEIKERAARHFEVGDQQLPARPLPTGAITTRFRISCRF